MLLQSLLTPQKGWGRHPEERENLPSRPVFRQSRAERSSSLFLSVPARYLRVAWGSMGTPSTGPQGISQQPKPITLLEVESLFGRSTRSVHWGHRKKDLHSKTSFQPFPRRNEPFSIRPHMGEIRQGALEGLVVDAIAKPRRFPSNGYGQALRSQGRS